MNAHYPIRWTYQITQCWQSGRVKTVITWKESQTERGGQSFDTLSQIPP
jgi:hypothetical protein